MEALIIQTADLNHLIGIVRSVCPAVRNPSKVNSTGCSKVNSTGYSKVSSTDNSKVSSTGYSKVSSTGYSKVNSTGYNKVNSTGYSIVRNSNKLLDHETTITFTTISNVLLLLLPLVLLVLQFFSIR